MEIFAIVTNEAVEDLGLALGKETMVLIKSSFVLPIPGRELRISARNRLYGTVREVVPGAVNSEVKLELPGGRVLTAIITRGSANRVGFRARTTRLRLDQGFPCHSRRQRLTHSLQDSRA